MVVIKRTPFVSCIHTVTYIRIKPIVNIIQVLDVYQHVYKDSSRENFGGVSQNEQKGRESIECNINNG